MRAWIDDAPIDVNRLLESIEHDRHGAIVLFVGTVRDLNEGRPVVGIQYEAYREMAARVLEQIVGEAEQAAGSCQIAAVHRVGRLEVGEASVAIAVSTPHRAAAFTASRYIIEEIKKRLPIWKQEMYADGGPVWLNGAHPAAEVGHD
jgi:molybdopterin synthase catalytic subunit